MWNGGIASLRSHCLWKNIFHLPKLKDKPEVTALVGRMGGFGAVLLLHCNKGGFPLVGDTSTTSCSLSNDVAIDHTGNEDPPPSTCMELNLSKF